MAEPTIIFNDLTGALTGVSGAPANFGPISGTNASVTSGSATIDLSADNPDLTNLPVDGSAVIYIETTSGRRMYKITGKDTALKTVTVDNRESGLLPSVTGTFAWAIGGKWKDWTPSSKITEDAYGGWTYIFETDFVRGALFPVAYTVVSSNAILNAPVLFTTDGPRRSLVATNWGYAGIGGSSNSVNVLFKNLRLSRRGSNHTLVSFPGTGQIWQFHNVIFDDDNGNAFGCIDNGNNTLRVVCDDCLFKNNPNPYYIRSMWGTVRSDPVIHLKDCVFAPVTASAATSIELRAVTVLRIENCVFYKCGPIVISLVDMTTYPAAWSTITIHNSTFFNIQGSAIVINVPAGVRMPLMTIENCIFAQCNGYGIECQTPDRLSIINVRNNCFWQNASGPTLQFPMGDNTLQVDPQFANPAMLDFRIGPNLKAKGWPKYDRSIGAGQSQTFSFVDLGAAQRKERPVPQRPVLVGVPDNAY